MRYLLFVLFGIYRRVWRFASGARLARARDRGRRSPAPLALGLLWLTQSLGDFPPEIFFVDALLCLVLVGASRMALRALPSDARPQPASAIGCCRRRRPLRRSLARELNETPGEHVVGFLDDNERLRRRRIQGVTVLGGLLDAGHSSMPRGPTRCW